MLMGFRQNELEQAHIYLAYIFLREGVNVCSEKYLGLRKPKTKPNLHVSGTSTRRGERDSEEAEVWFFAVSREKGSGAGHQGDIINEIKPQNLVILLFAILFSPV